MKYWLMKTEPESFSIHDLAAAPDQTTFWDGVRNYQARNFMRAMKVGDRVLFYHSNADPPAVVGTATVCREAYPDFTQFDPEEKQYDPKARPESPAWEMVDLRLESIFDAPLPLELLKSRPELEGMEVLRRGSRLSVQAVDARHFEAVLELAAGQAKQAKQAEHVATAASMAAPSPRQPSASKASKKKATKKAARKKAANTKTRNPPPTQKKAGKKKVANKR